MERRGNETPQFAMTIVRCQEINTNNLVYLTLTGISQVIRYDASRWMARLKS